MNKVTPSAEDESGTWTARERGVWCSSDYCLHGIVQLEYIELKKCIDNRLMIITHFHDDCGFAPSQTMPSLLSIHFFSSRIPSVSTSIRNHKIANSTVYVQNQMNFGVRYSG